MEIETTYDFVHAVKLQLHPKEFEAIKDLLLIIPAEHRAAFWHYISDGNSSISALKYCKNLYEFVRNNFMDFKDALKLIRCNDIKLKAKAHSRKLMWYENN